MLAVVRNPELNFNLILYMLHYYVVIVQGYCSVTQCIHFSRHSHDYKACVLEGVKFVIGCYVFIMDSLCNIRRKYSQLYSF